MSFVTPNPLGRRGDGARFRGNIGPAGPTTDMGDDAAHAAGAAVCGPLARHRDPALARSICGNRLLYVPANCCRSYTTDRRRLCAVRAQRNRLDQLLRAGPSDRFGSQNAARQAARRQGPRHATSSAARLAVSQQVGECLGR